MVLVTKTYKTQYDSKNLIEPMINPFLRDTYLQKMNIRMTMSVDPRNESRTVVRVLKCSKYLFYKAQFKVRLNILCCYSKSVKLSILEYSIYDRTNQKKEKRE